MDKYFLSTHSGPQEEISEKEFNKFIEAKKIISSIHELEENFDLLATSYFELEKEISEILLKSMIYKEVGYGQFIYSRLSVNLKLATFLTSARMYKDQSRGNVKKILHTQLFNEKNDIIFEFNLLELMRNELQHSNLIVNPAGHGWKILPQDENSNNYNINDPKTYTTEHTINLVMSLDSLKNNNHKVTKSFIEKNPSLPDTICLLKSIRIYMDNYMDIHMKFRDHLESKVKNAENLLINTRKHYEKSNPECKLHSLAVYKEEDQFVHKNKYWLLMDWINERKKLATKNTMNKLEGSYITSKPKKSEPKG